MKKIELLSPVGDFGTLKYAVYGGSDAVYLGTKKFNARMFSSNFTDEELINAVKFCHLYGVKIYITVNTIIFDNEIDEFLDRIKFLHEIGVDALIMQDIGMIKLVKETFPNLEIHASTQVHNHSNDVLNYLQTLGVKRVVLARELSLSEINKMNTNIEKEVFIHGALCVSYSGCCLFSSMNGHRSANRGECVASCRLPYKLVKNNKVLDLEDKYLLSMKELNSLYNLKEILDSRVDSLKIEGRMKSKEYVYYITSLYRKLIDNYYLNKELVITEEEITNLKKLFNREFSKGFINNEVSNDIVNTKSPNHIGVDLGKVIDVNKRFIKIKLLSSLHMEDGIRFNNSNKGMIINKLYNDKMLLTNKVNKGSIAYVDNKIDLTTKDTVSKTIDSKLIKELNNIEQRKIEVDFIIEAKLNKKLKLTISDGVNSIREEGNIIEKALNNPTTKDRIILQIEKLGNTPFRVRTIKEYIDNDIFIPIKELNELRRKLTNKLKELRENTKKEVIINNYNLNNKKDRINNRININVLVRNKEQLEVALNNNINNIYITDYDLYKEYKDNTKYKSNIFYRTSRVSKNNKNFSNVKLLVTELGAYNKYSSANTVVTDYYLNVTNRYSYSLLNEKTTLVTLSPEFKNNNYNKYYNAEIIIYGRIELMLMKYCPLNKLVNKDKICRVCKSNNKYYLKDKDKLYPITSENETTHIMHYKNIDLLNNLDYYLSIGIRNFRIELFDENKTEADRIINIVKNRIGG